MSKQFLYLTSSKGKPVIIGINNIAVIEKNESSAGAQITLNFARDKEMWPKVIYVRQNLEQIEEMLKACLIK